ncbi:MAG: MBL fold metallo-hydrolase [Clostridia bacterium]
MQFGFCPLRSGSSGNTSYVCAGATRLLIDAGLSGRAMEKMLWELGQDPQGLTGILVTHEHSDHIKGLGIFSRRYNLPVYANEETWQAMADKPGMDGIATRNQRIFITGQDFYVQDVGVTPFAIPHDAAAPVGYALAYGGRKLAIATDLGHIAESWVSQVSGADLLLIESNHDPEMLADSRYPALLKRRILSRRGHLSNADCGRALVTLTQQGMHHVILGHLSAETNTPPLARETVEIELAAAGLRMGEDVRVDMAWRDKLGDFYTIIA